MRRNVYEYLPHISTYPSLLCYTAELSIASGNPMLNRDDVDEYRRIYKKIYGVQLSYQEALEQASRLLRFFKVIYKPQLNNKFPQDKS